MSELIVGTILKPQGIRGELKVKPFTDTAEVFSGFDRVFLDGVPYKILSVRTGDGFVYLGLRGVPDRNAAELLRGKSLTLPREEAPEPAEGSYYIADLIGCAIVTEEGEKLGVLADVTPAATDVYTLKRATGEEIIFPAAKGVVLSVDPEKRTVVVSKRRYLEVAVL